MGIAEKIEEVVASSARHTATGSGELPQAVFDHATALFDEEQTIAQVSGLLGEDAKRFFTHGSIAVGALTGYHERLREMMRRESPEGLSQNDAFTLVDLWGRALGAKALLVSVSREVEGARQGGVQPGALLARMGATFDLLEALCMATVAELARFGTLSVIGDAIDKLIAMLRAEREGALGRAVSAHIENLPA